MGKIERLMLVATFVGSVGSVISAYFAMASYCGWREIKMIPSSAAAIPLAVSLSTIIWGISTILFLVSTVILIWYGTKKGVWRRSKQKSTANRLEIRSIGNTAIEPFLQWLHLAVEPSASLKVAREARVTLKVELDQRIKERPEPTVYSMRWASDEGPKEERTLRYGQPGSIPLVIRSSIDVGISGYGEAPHTIVKRNICYITDDQFLIHQNPIHRLPEAGKHKLTISVFYGDHNESVSKVYELGVHHPASGSNLIYIIAEEAKV